MVRDLQLSKPPVLSKVTRGCDRQRHLQLARHAPVLPTPPRERCPGRRGQNWLQAPQPSPAWDRDVVPEVLGHHEVLLCRGGGCRWPRAIDPTLFPWEVGSCLRGQLAFSFSSLQPDAFLRVQGACLSCCLPSCSCCLTAV